MLREYLLHDLTPADSSWMKEYDKERLLDDFVCLMILLGDDFLPELPSLDINEGSVQFVINTYKSALCRRLTRRTIIASMHAFLVEDAQPVLPVLKALLRLIGKGEPEVFAARKAEEEAQKMRGPRESRFEQRQSSPPVASLCLHYA